MRYPRVIPSFLASLLIASSAPAQTADGPTANLPEHNQIAAARSQYTQTAEISPDANDDTVAQLPRRGPRTPFPPRQGYPRGSYPTPWMEHRNPGHALIGAAIGFGLGATLGALSNAHKGAPVGSGALVGGALFGFIGGAIGAAHGGPHMFARRTRVYRPSWPEADEESHLRSHSKDGHAEQSVSARPASPSPPTGVEAMALPSPGMPAIP
jgi:hypothetical protein